MNIELQYTVVCVFSLFAIVLYLVWIKGNREAMLKQAYKLKDSALLARQSNDWVKAQMLLEQSLQLMDKLANVDDSWYASCLLGLAESYEKNGKNSESKAMYKKLLSFWNSLISAPDVSELTYIDIDYFVSQHTFGSATSDVASFYQVALLKREKALGAKHLNVIHGKQLLVRLLKDAGRKQEAKQLEDNLNS
jgi:tetratricopeptide (TPR) repeat protein